MAADGIGYCGGCGTPLSAGAVGFCGHCGAPIPVVPAAVADHRPVGRPRLGHARLLLAVGAALAVVVTVITLVAVMARPISGPACGFFCGPRVGPRLAAPTVYANARWGFSIEYPPQQLSIVSQDTDHVTFNETVNNSGTVEFIAAPGSDVSAANARVLGNLSTASFQGIEPIGDVHGAEIGFVLGQGTAYSASFVASGTAEPVGILIFSASRDGMTITVVAIGVRDTSMGSLLPYGLVDGELFDHPVSNTIWKGQR